MTIPKILVVPALQLIQLRFHASGFNTHIPKRSAFLPLAVIAPRNVSLRNQGPDSLRPGVIESLQRFSHCFLCIDVKSKQGTQHGLANKKLSLFGDAQSILLLLGRRPGVVFGLGADDRPAKDCLAISRRQVAKFHISVGFGAIVSDHLIRHMD